MPRNHFEQLQIHDRTSMGIDRKREVRRRRASRPTEQIEAVHRSSIPGLSQALRRFVDW